MGINLNPFTWWNGATMGHDGSACAARRGSARMRWATSIGRAGSDTAGNPRRWVIYNGSNDASRVPPEWFGVAASPDRRRARRALPPRAAWQKPAVPNMTGTALAYRPSGALEKGGRRAAATGDYEAWTPDS